MKNIIILVLAILFVFSCGKDNENTDPFKGEDLTPSKTIGKVGNYWDLESRGFDISGKVTVSSNDNGITVFEAVLSDVEDKLGVITYKGEKISDDSPMILRAKISTNTIATFDYGSKNNDDPFVLVKFDGKKGDKYTYTSDGKTSVREITNEKFEVEAYGWIIKTMEIEETVPENTFNITTKGGVSFNVTKIRYLVNHKFGFVFVSFYVNGTSFPLLIIDGVNTNCDTK